MAEPSTTAERSVVSARAYTLGSLGAIAATLLLALFGLVEYLWVPLGVLVVLWLSLVNVMWEAVRLERRRLTPLWATLLLVLPPAHLVAPLWVFGGYPRAFDEAARVYGLHGLEGPDGAGPSRGAFVAFAVSWMLLVGAATWVLLVRPRDVVALEVLLPPAFLWLPLSLAITWQAARSVNALATARAPGDRLAAAEAEWQRERAAVLDALRGRHPADRAWAADMVRRYATRGVAEAAEMARASQRRIFVGVTDGPIRVPMVIGLLEVRSPGPSAE